MKRKLPVARSALREVFPDRRVPWLIGTITATAASVGLVTFDFERPPGTWWWVALVAISIAGLWFWIHVGRALGWRRAVRFAVGHNPGRWLFYLPPQTVRERSFSGWLAWTAFCLATGTFLAVMIIFTVRIWS